MKINMKYRYRETDQIELYIIRYYERNKRLLKKRLKLVLTNISATLNINEWDITINVIDNGAYYYSIDIELKDKNSNLSGALMYCEKTEFNQYTKNTQYILKSFRHDVIINSLDIKSNFKNENNIFMLVIRDFSKEENLLEFSTIEHPLIQDFKKKYESFYNYLIKENIYDFSPNNVFCGLKNFYISDDIYWNSAYTFNSNHSIARFDFSNIRKINLNEEKVFILSMIEAKVIHINQDIEEVLTWDIKDIFAMSKLIGY